MSSGHVLMALQWECERKNLVNILLFEVFWTDTLGMIYDFIVFINFMSQMAFVKVLIFVICNPV